MEWEWAKDAQRNNIGQEAQDGMKTNPAEVLGNIN